MTNPIMKFFAYQHLPERLQQVSKPIGELAQQLDESLPDSAEKSAGLRKLLEAKDCFVRATLVLLFALFATGSMRSQSINPATQIQWPLVTASGTPTAACTSANYGQPYTDVLHNTQYICMASGWVNLSTSGGATDIWSTYTYGSGMAISGNSAYNAATSATVLINPTDTATGTWYDNYILNGSPANWLTQRSIVDLRDGWFQFDSVNPANWHGWSQTAFGINCKLGATPATPQAGQPGTSTCASIGMNSDTPGQYLGFNGSSDSGDFGVHLLSISANVYTAGMDKSSIQETLNVYGSGDTQVHDRHFTNDYGGMEHGADEGWHIIREIDSVGLNEFRGTIGSVTPNHSAGRTQLWLSSNTGTLGVMRLLIDTTQAITDTIASVPSTQGVAANIYGDGSGDGYITMTNTSYPISTQASVSGVTSFSTTATFSYSSITPVYTVTVADATGISIGSVIGGTGTGGGTVTAISGTTITLSNATTAAGSGVAVTFSVPQPQDNNYETKTLIAVPISTTVDLSAAQPLTSTGPQACFVTVGSSECATVQSYGPFISGLQWVKLLLGDAHFAGDPVYFGGMAGHALTIDGDVVGNDYGRPVLSTFYVYGSTANNILVVGRQVQGHHDFAPLRPAAVHIYPAARVLDVRSTNPSDTHDDDYVAVEETAAAWAPGDTVEAGLMATSYHDDFYYYMVDNSPYTGGHTYWWLMNGNQVGAGRDFMYLQNTGTSTPGYLFRWTGVAGGGFNFDHVLLQPFLYEHNCGFYFEQSTNAYIGENCAGQVQTVSQGLGFVNSNVKNASTMMEGWTIGGSLQVSPNGLVASFNTDSISFQQPVTEGTTTINQASVFLNPSALVVNGLTSGSSAPAVAITGQSGSTNSALQVNGSIWTNQMMYLTSFHLASGANCLIGLDSSGNVAGCYSGAITTTGTNLASAFKVGGIYDPPNGTIGGLSNNLDQFVVTAHCAAGESGGACGQLALSSDAGYTVTAGGTVYIKANGTSAEIQQTGDSFGATSLTLENRSGLNGALFQNSGLDIVDFGFLDKDNYQQNIRVTSHTSIHGYNNSKGEFDFSTNTTNQGSASLIDALYMGGASAQFYAGSTAGMVSINVAGGTNPNAALAVNGGVTIGTYAGTQAAPSNGLAVSGLAQFGNLVQFNTYTVSGLPTCSTAGQVAVVTDASSPTFLGTLTGGGSTKSPVLCNGSAWVAY